MKTEEKKADQGKSIEREMGTAPGSGQVFDKQEKSCPCNEAYVLVSTTREH
jgi:hypothetical protein